ncbi:MAG TPA: phosphotransferase family protein [Gemmataceae bacterium]|nr:phosphotransferase family protein [Gemmataceae bacterium]
MTRTLNEFRDNLEAWLSRQAGGVARVTAARQLTGGASRDTWAVDVAIDGGPEAGRHALVLRRDLGGVIHDEALSREQEFRLLAAAHAAGVKVPRPRWLGGEPAALGAPFFLMDRLDGESVGRRVVREPALAEARRSLPRQMGEQLALIHRIDPCQPGLKFLPAPAPGQSPAQAALESSARQLARSGEPHPVLELALRWLRCHAPACDHPVLVHGDFRVGNLMVGPDGLRGVFDWEFAHVGDPAEDLAWPCVRSWRFGQDRLRLGGVGDAEEFFAAYEQAGGRPVDREAVAYWEVLGNFRWAVGCVVQAGRHLSGQAPSVELASLGRRTAEVELELLDLLGAGPPAARSVS